MAATTKEKLFGYSQKRSVAATRGVIWWSPEKKINLSPPKKKSYLADARIVILRHKKS